MARVNNRTEARKRGKYGRPCDMCSMRRIRCVFPPNALRCTGCSTQNCECTNKRVRKKLGPKPLHLQQPTEIAPEENHSTPSLSLLDQLSLFSEPLLRLTPRYVTPHSRTPGPSEEGPHYESRYDINPNIAPTINYLAQLSLMAPTSTITEEPISFATRNPSASPHVGQQPAGVPTSEGSNRAPDLLPPFCIPSAGLPPEYASIPIDKILPCLQVYQTWFYGYWPVLLVADLMLTLVGNSDMDDLSKYFLLTERNAMSYALCCAVCATILTQMTFVQSKIKFLNIDAYYLAQKYAEDAKRVRQLFDYTDSPDVTTLLTSFFLYTHYVNVKGKMGQAMMYLREAITACQLLGLHEPITYVNKSSAEVHRCKKIYYMLLVTERFMCFEDGLPVILDPVIEIPSLQNEEYPSLLAGFTELVRVFAAPSKNFFGELNQKSTNMDLAAFFRRSEGQNIEDKKSWVLNVHQKLQQPLSDAVEVSDSQKLNIVLSRAWIQAIAWHITSENGLVTQLADPLNCLSLSFPLKIVDDFLLAVEHLPLFAFETNGPGICVKLLAIGNSLNRAFLQSNGNRLMADRLNTLFSLVTRYKNDVSLPMDRYLSIANTISQIKNFVPRPLSSSGYEVVKVEEILDSDDKTGLIFDDQQMVGQVARVTHLPPMYKEDTGSPLGDPFAGMALEPAVQTPVEYDALSKSKTNSALSIIDMMHAFAQDQLIQNKSDACAQISPGFIP